MTGGTPVEPVVLELDGELELSVLESRPERSRIQFCVSPSRVQINGAEDHRLISALSAPFYVEVEPSGEFVAFEFPSDTGDQVAEHLRSLVECFQVVLDPDSGERWITDEQDGAGQFQAQYRQHSSELIKEKQRYARLEPSLAKMGSMHIVRSRNSIQRSATAGGWVDSVRVEERSELVRGSQVMVSAQLDATLKKLPYLGALAPAPLARIESPPVRPARHPAAESAVADESWRSHWEEILAEFRAGNSSRLLARELATLLIRHPDASAAVVASEVLASLDDSVMPRLFEALADAGHSQAQAALGKALEAPELTDKGRTQALFAIGGLDHPVGASVATLARVEQSARTGARPQLASAALLALGRVARRLDGQDGAARTEAMRILSDRLASAHDTRSRVEAITAIRNSTDPDLTAEVVPSLFSAESRVRLAAAKTMLALPDTNTPGRLSQVLDLEEDPRMRLQLIDAYHESAAPGGAFLDAIERRGPQESDPAVRRSMARFLVARSAESRDGVEGIRRWIESEDDDLTRFELYRALRPQRARLRRP